MSKECIYHLRGFCRNEPNCKHLHYDKKTTKIIFEDFNKKFLIGKIDQGELYIPLHLIEKFYHSKKIEKPKSYIQMNYVVTINPKKNVNHSNRYTVGTIISLIEYNEDLVNCNHIHSNIDKICSIEYNEDLVNFHQIHLNIDKRLAELNEKIEKQTFDFNKSLAKTKLEYNLKLDEYKKNEIRLHTQIGLLNERIYCLEQLLHKITSYTFLNDINK